MKFLTSLFLLVGLTMVAKAQTVPSTLPAPTDILILKQSWAEERVPGWEKVPNGPEPFDVMMERVANEQRMQQARNARNPGAITRSEREAKLIEKATVTEKNAKNQERPRFGYRYKIRVRNLSAKKIEAVDWDYVFLDLETQNEIARHQFTSEEKIAPGKEKDLSVFILSPPVKAVNAGTLREKGHGLFAERAVLVRIQYSDGSVWQNP